MILNVIASDILPNPRFKRWALKGMTSNEYVGDDIILSPGARIEGSRLGDFSGYGINATVIDSTIGEDGRLGANCFIEDATLGENCVVAANAIVTCDVPPNSVVRGHNLITPIADWVNNSHRSVHREYFDRAPCWYWEDLAHHMGGTNLIRSVVRYAIHTYLPRLINPSARFKGKFESLGEEQGEGVVIDRSALVDPLLPGSVRIGDGVHLGPKVILLAHSGVNIVQNVFESGPVTIGNGTNIGFHSVVLPGVSVPAELHIPPYSVITAHGVYLVRENQYLAFEELR